MGKPGWDQYDDLNQDRYDDEEEDMDDYDHDDHVLLLHALHHH